MNEDFKTLFELLEPSVKEVAGREAPVVASELQKRLARLAAGESNEEERRQLLDLLDEEPQLLPALVEEIKKLRRPAKS